jgi:hypothetical protein
VQGLSGEWAYDGVPIPFPDAYSMAIVPAGVYAALLQESHFRELFTTVLDTLLSAGVPAARTT